jgi:hypothetical protein
VVPERSAWERRNEPEYICNLILTLGAKYVSNYLAAEPQVPDEWGRQAILVFLLRDLTEELPNLMGQSPQRIKEVLDTRAFKCLGFMEGMTYEAARSEQAEVTRGQQAQAQGR